MSKGLHKLLFHFSILSVFLLAGISLSAQKTWDGGAGTSNWGDANNWNPNGVPGSSDAVTIGNTFTVVLNTNATIASLTVGGGTSGSLTIGNSNTDRTLTVSGNVVVNAGATITAGGNGGNIFNVGGNLTNSGTFTDNSGSVDVTFNGSVNQSISGAGTTTRFNTITVSNTGTSPNNIVEVTSSNFAAAAGFLTITDGIFKLSGSFSLTNTVFSTAGYTIPSGGGFWLNNSNVTITGQSSTPNLDGSIRITNGTYNVGTSSGNSLEYSTGSVFTMEGGTLNVAGRFSGTGTTQTTTFSMSGGTINVGTVGNGGSRGTFDISASGSSFTMSAGTIIIQNESTNASPLDYRNVAGTNNITGGTVQFGTSGVSGSPTYVVGTSGTNNFPNLTLVKAATATTVTLSTAITVTGNITFPSSTTFTTGANAISLSGNWSNSGTFTTATTNTVTFNGTTAQTIGGASTTTFNNLTINNAAGATLNSPANMGGTLTLTNGILTTTSTNIISVTNTATTAISAGSTSKFIKGPVKWSIGTGTYIFPVGKGTGNYFPFKLATSASSSPVVTVEAFDADAGAGATFNPALSSISHTEYWSAALNSGTFTGSVSLTRIAPLTTEDAIAQSTAQGGSYNSIGGAAATPSINNSNNISSLGFFVMATIAKNCPASTAVTPSADQAVCQGVATNQLTANVTLSGGTGNPTIQYQWYYNTTNSNTITGATLVSGATNQTYTPPSTATEAGTTRYYFCVGYASNNGCGQSNATQSLASNTVKVTVYALPAAGTCNQVPDYCYANAGSIDVQASGGTAPYSVTWTPAHGMTQPASISSSGGILTVTGLHAGTTYTFVVKDANNCQAP